MQPVVINKFRTPADLNNSMQMVDMAKGAYYKILARRVFNNPVKFEYELVQLSDNHVVAYSENYYWLSEQHEHFETLQLKYSKYGAL